MNKKIEDAAREYSNNNAEGIGLGHDDDAFKAGAEWALREAIEICNQFTRTDTISTPFNESAICGIKIIRSRIEELLSSEDKFNDQR